MRIKALIITCAIMSQISWSASPAMAGSDVQTKAARRNTVQSIPVLIKGKTLEIHRELTRAEIRTAMNAIITDEPSVDTEERLQYDIQLVREQAPVTIVFDFSKKGTVAGIMIDSFTREQNPPVTALLEWLKVNAGRPSVKKKGTITWIFGGWKIKHTDKGTGEDSVYRIEFSAIK